MDVIKKSREVFTKKLFPRTSYIQTLQTLCREPLITIVKGQRRVGKSSVIIGYIQSLSIDLQTVFYLNKEYDERDTIPTTRELSECFDQFVDEYGEPSYIIIDEIQDIQGREKFIRSKNASGAYHIIISGSNSSLLSGEFATFLTGRHMDMTVYPLSYVEYLDMTQTTSSTQSLFDYIQYGGLPDIISMSTTQAKTNYISGVLSDIILKDVVARHKIKDISLLQKLLSYVASTAGKIVSVRNIANYLQTQEHMTISIATVSRYMSYLSQPYIINKIPRYDLVGKEILQYKDKYFFTDIGIKNTLHYDLSQDLSGILENLVCIHAQRSGYEVYVGERDGKEIDFVLIKGSEKLYIQVAHHIIDEKTRAREFGNLLLIPDNYKKIVVSLDEIAPTLVQGVHRITMKDFLSTTIS